jgi:phosphate transport system permease protein
MKIDKIIDPAFKRITWIAALSVLVLAAAIIFIMISQSTLSLHKFGFGFLSSTKWDPVNENFGALPFIYGTVVSSLLALVIAVPFSMGIAIYLSEIAPYWIKKPLGFLIELLAAIPSVIYGLWGIFLLAPFLRNYIEPFLSKTLGFLPLFQGNSIGIGMLAAGIILSIMIIPTISSISRDVFAAVPIPLKEAAMALGATKWETISLAILKSSKTGVVGAIMLGLGRALGETMAVTMVIGNMHVISASLFAPSSTMASVIANEFTEATTNTYASSLVEIGLVLFFVTLALNAIARLLVWSVSGKFKGEA